MKRWNIRRSSLAVVLVLAAGLVPAQEAQNQEAQNEVSLDSRDRIFYPGDTETWKPLAGKLLANTLLDQKEIWTSPFHMRGEDIKWWVGIAGVTAALVATDHRSSNVFENSPGQVSWGNNLSRIGASYTLLPVVAGFYGYGLIRDDPKPREVGVLGAEALLDSLIVVEVLKPIAGRNRPDSAITPGTFLRAAIRFLRDMRLNLGHWLQ